MSIKIQFLNHYIVILIVLFFKFSIAKLVIFFLFFSFFIITTHGWINFGSKTPQLQEFSIIILIHTYNALGYELNWLVFKQIHTKK
jgi:hypothetical protein